MGFLAGIRVAVDALLVNKGRSILTSLGIDPANVRGWVEKFSGEAGVAPSGEGALQVELRRLRKENARLLMERDILKKAAAFFAKEQP